MAGRPEIAVTGPDGHLAFAWWATRLAVFLSGGRAVRLTPSNFRKHQKEGFRAVIIGGGNDIDAEMYGGKNTGRSPIDEARDRFESEMVRYAVATHLPILGICRGAQLINVVLGGSLFADIRSMRRLTSNRRTPFPRKTALAEAEGILRRTIGSERWRINSLHSQAIERLGEGLRVVARDLDSFVQAFESYRYRWLVGVQWHPEYLLYLSGQLRIFRDLVAQARHADPESLILEEEE